MPDQLPSGNRPNITPKGRAISSVIACDHKSTAQPHMRRPVTKAIYVERWAGYTHRAAEWEWEGALMQHTICPVHPFPFTSARNSCCGLIFPARRAPILRPKPSRACKYTQTFISPILDIFFFPPVFNGRELHYITSKFF